MDNFDYIVLILLIGIFLLLAVVFLKMMVLESLLRNSNKLDPHDAVLAKELARLEYEDRKIELQRKKAEEEARLKAEAEVRAIEQEEINRLSEEARNFGIDD